MAKDDWMIDNTGGEFTPKQEEESVGSQIVGALGRTLQALPDALAKQKPIIGMPLQALFNTDEYQARQAGYQMAKERLADYKAGAELRKKKRENDLTAENLRTEQIPQQAATDLAKLKAGEAQAKTAEERAKAASAALPEEQALLQERRDQEIYNSKISQARERFWMTCANNGMFNNFSYDELENLKKQHPAEFKMFFEATTAFELFQDALSGDKNAEGLIDRWCRKNGLRYVKGSDGVPMLMRRGGREDGEDAPVLELTPDGLKRFYQSTQNPVVAEINARSGLTEQAVRGNPAKINLANNIKALLPYCGYSCVKAGQFVQSIMNDMKEKNPDTYDRSFAINNCVQAISDFRSGKSGAMQELFSGIAPNNNAPQGELAKLGITTVPEIDPANIKLKPEDVKNLMFKIEGKDGLVTFDELYDHLRENDVFGKKMQERIGFLQEASLMSMMRNARARQGMVRTTGKTSGSQASEAQEPQTPREQEHKADIDFGSKFIKSNQLTEDANRIWNVISRNPKSQIKSKEQLDACFGNAAMQALYKYRQTNDYDDANAAFIEAMKDYDIPEKLIPKHLWAKGKIAQLTAQIKDLGRKREEQMKNPNWTQSSGNMAVPSPRGGGALIPLPSPRDKYVAQRQFLTEQLQKAEAQQREREKQQSPKARKARQKEDDAFLFGNI